MGFPILVNCNWVNFGNVQVPSTGWILDVNDVRNTNAGNIGIGAPFPTHAKLEIRGQVGSAIAMFGSDKNGVTISADNPEIGLNYFYNNGTKTIKAGYGANIGMFPNSGDVYIGNFNGNQSSTDFGSITGYQNVMTFKQNGNVGIGTDPFVKFHVKYGSSGITPYGIAAFESNTDAFVNLMTPSNNQSGVLFGSPLSSTRGGIIYNHSNGNNAESLVLRTGGNLNRMVINNMGNVAIGDFLPTTKLDVDGGIKGKGLFMPIKYITAGVNYSVQDGDYTLIVDANGQCINQMYITLPNHFANPGRIINVVYINAPNCNVFTVGFKDYQGNIISADSYLFSFNVSELGTDTHSERKNITLQCTGNNGYSWIKIGDNYFRDSD